MSPPKRILLLTNSEHGQASSYTVTPVDPAFSPAVTACVHAKARFCILAPNTIKDFSMPFQPWTTPLTLNRLNRFPPPGVRHLVANLPELEFPRLRVPPHLVPCGPMVRPAPAVSAVDPDLAAWLARGPTVYINTSTLHQTTEWDALEIARALRALFDHQARAQATAERYSDNQMEEEEKKKKVKAKDDDKSRSREKVVGEDLQKGSRIHGVLEEEIDADRVRIVPWLHPEPSAILAEPNVICSVHHGGANSFLEAVSAGVPHILLDIGRWANRRMLPLNSARELAPALIEMVLSKEHSQVMRRRAGELARVCGRDAGGRVVAARTIMEQI
ncbi:hypothetical protein PG994_013557 [Apiospora phragmitis]|uniref:Glycosyltransferase n=1 Tax=Apiospora phragmitis TaxID=2905665 RepID=A0ABR1T919_9PEZI